MGEGSEEEGASLKRARAADCQRIGASNKQVCTGIQQQEQTRERCIKGGWAGGEGAAEFSSCPANRLA